MVGLKLGFCMVEAVPVILKRALGSYISKEKKNIRHSTGRQQQWAPITIAFSALGNFETWVIHKKYWYFAQHFIQKRAAKVIFFLIALPQEREIHLSSVPSKDYQFGPIRQNLNYFRGSLSQNFQILLKIGWFTKKKHLFYTLSQILLTQFLKDLSQLCAIGP